MSDFVKLLEDTIDPSIFQPMSDYELPNHLTKVYRDRIIKDKDFGLSEMAAALVSIATKQLDKGDFDLVKFTDPYLAAEASKLFYHALSGVNDYHRTIDSIEVLADKNGVFPDVIIYALDRLWNSAGFAWPEDEENYDYSF